MQKKLFVIDTSDQRCKYLYRLIKSKGCKVTKLDLEKINNYADCIVIFSPSKLLQLADIIGLERGSIVFGGKANNASRNYMNASEINYINILEDEIFLVKNTLPTAEGCLKLIIENTDQTFHDLKALILGYGRVSKTLTKYLVALGVNTHIYSIDSKEKNLALLNTNGVLENLDELWDFDVIINTIPATILTEKHIAHIKKGSFFCDLASGNFHDLEDFTTRDIVAIKALALPGKISPKSASKYLYTSIFDTLNSKEMNL